MLRRNPDIWAIAFLLLMFGAAGIAREAAFRLPAVERRMVLVGNRLEQAGERAAERANLASQRAEEGLRRAEVRLNDRARHVEQRLEEAMGRLEQRFQERVVERINCRFGGLFR